jgi:hypothetical protein
MQNILAAFAPILLACSGASYSDVTQPLEVDGSADVFSEATGPDTQSTEITESVGSMLEASLSDVAVVGIYHDEASDVSVADAPLDVNDPLDADAGPVIGCKAGEWSLYYPAENFPGTCEVAGGGPGATGLLPSTAACAGNMTCACMKANMLGYASECMNNASNPSLSCVEDAGAVYLYCP